MLQGRDLPGQECSTNRLGLFWITRSSVLAGPLTLCVPYSRLRYPDRLIPIRGTICACGHTRMDDRLAFSLRMGQGPLERLDRSRSESAHHASFSF